jgi:hypothetical protein
MNKKYQMKNILQLFLSLAIITTFTFGNCKRNQNPNPVDELPPETQTGANTFGCLIDGKVFLPKGNPLAGPVKKAQYQFANGRQGFGISASRSDGEESQSVGVGGDSIIINVGVYELSSRNNAGKLSGLYIVSKIGTLGNYYYTNEIQKGQINIKHFDTINQIVSGTFWFDALNSTTGKIVQVREGRFDMPYVK